MGQSLKMKYRPAGGITVFLALLLHACLSLGTFLILLSHVPALRVAIIRHLHLLDSMWLGPYVSSHDNYISLVHASCLRSLSPHVWAAALLSNDTGMVFLPRALIFFPPMPNNEFPAGSSVRLFRPIDLKGLMNKISTELPASIQMLCKV